MSSNSVEFMFDTDSKDVQERLARGGADADKSGSGDPAVAESGEASGDESATPGVDAPEERSETREEKKQRRITQELELQDLEVMPSAPPPPPARPEGSERKEPDQGPAAWNPIAGETLKASGEAGDDREVAGSAPAPPIAPSEADPPTEAAGHAARSNRRFMMVMMVGASVGLVAGGFFGLRDREQPVPSGSPETEFGARLDTRVMAAASPDAAVYEQDSAASDLPRADSRRPDLLVAAPDAPPKAAPRPRVASRPRARPGRASPKAARSKPPRPRGASKEAAKTIYMEGLRHLMRGQNKQAIDKFNQTLKVSRRFALAYRGLGLAYEKIGRKAMARASFRRYITLRKGAADIAVIRKRIKRLK